ncbi:hypothetical protein ABES21_05465, partial [Peribacillus frigoritolerans]|uniref:hypothetical protein n=1 Tax=Peribacillus frigoritolerans TaxID=450367 RepID=UPI003D2CF2E6
MDRNRPACSFMLKNVPVDWNVRYETPAGKAWPRETPQALPRRLPDRPRKASALRSNQRSDLL